MESSEEDSLSDFSNDSDDDRTWRPPNAKKIRHKWTLSKGLNRSYVNSNNKGNKNKSGQKGYSKCSDVITVTVTTVKTLSNVSATYSTSSCSTTSSSSSSGYYCELCNVHLKSASAFKSHRIKMHLERTKPVFYCRQCDTSFECKVEHQTHIVQHKSDPRCLQCSVCGKLFAQSAQLERHLATHDRVNIDKPCVCSKCNNETSKGSNECNETGGPRSSQLLSRMQANFSATSATATASSTSTTTTSSALTTKTSTSLFDPNRLERNWAAEFGCSLNPNTNTSNQANNLISAMKRKFKVDNDEDNEDLTKENSDDKVFRSRGFTGTEKAGLPKMPRTLSQSSIAAKQRMERKIRRVRHLQECERLSNTMSSPSVQSVTNASASLTRSGSASDDETLSDDEDEDEEDEEGVLIPMENGWVCEKKLNSKSITDVVASFWSPDGEQFHSLAEIEASRKALGMKVDTKIFNKALKADHSALLATLV